MHSRKRVKASYGNGTMVVVKTCKIATKIESKWEPTTQTETTTATFTAKLVSTHFLLHPASFAHIAHSSRERARHTSFFSRLHVHLWSTQSNFLCSPRKNHTSAYIHKCFVRSQITRLTFSRYLWIDVFFVFSKKKTRFYCCRFYLLAITEKHTLKLFWLSSRIVF